ncbi:carboxymuconolactone decarboxylase family protein [Nocardia sp. NPDC051990]|uniref:carboxymuconolactone decarboxylase family protein n=1 Tax=Nocardia sp. NPDC051990 TaxID=3155285 RepID=UPI003442AE58
MSADDTSMPDPMDDAAADAGPWNTAALSRLRTWAPEWADACNKMATNPWCSRVLSRKFAELVCVGLAVACTNLDIQAARRHMRAALAVGATRSEILFVIKCATVVSLHSCSVAAPILLDEAQAGGGEPVSRTGGQPTPSCDAMRAAGQWNDAWNPFFDLDPVWTEEFMATGVGIYRSGVMSAKEIELLSIALDASVTHLYSPGIRRHIKAALGAGATTQEIVEVLKLCVAQGVQACNLGVAILADELSRIEPHE